MKLTKYGHACVVLEERGEKVIIDPGEFTPDFGDANNVVAVVVTHVHGDHINAVHLQKIIAANPEVKVFTTPETAKEWGDPHAQAVKAGEEQTAGSFKLSFFGELHKVVHADWPQAQNVAVMVNDTFYYPGDSFTLPGREVKTLALPVSAPWLRTGEAIDFMKTVKPGLFFRTHDGLWNSNGLATTDTWLKMASEKFGSEYRALNPGESIEI